MNTLQQELPKRFTEAVSKLYNAFHGNRLNAWNCEACAVGNICNNNTSWAVVVTPGASKEFGNIQDGEKLISQTGYSTKELFTIEEIFLASFDGFRDGKNKDKQFKGLCAVVKYLCELDNIPKIMDFTSLFETENDKPVKKLQFV